MYAEFSGKLTFVTPCYAHVCVRIKGLDMLIFRKILRTYQMDGPFGKPKDRTQQSAFHNEFSKIIELCQIPDFFQHIFLFLTIHYSGHFQKSCHHIWI